jgi:hypothetical protein
MPLLSNDAAHVTQPACFCARAAFSSRIFFWVISDLSEGCREGFSDTNKKTNYRIRQETARQI